MRLNGGTVLLVIVALAVIVGVLVFSNQQAAAPGDPTATPATVSGEVFSGVTAQSVNITNFNSGEYVTFTQDSGGAWDIAGTYSSNVTEPQQDLVATNVLSASSLEFTDQFPSDQLAGFGLDQPLYALTMIDAAGQQYILYVGGQNPSGNRYYAVATRSASTSTAEPMMSTPSDATPEVTAEMTAEATMEATAEITPDLPLTSMDITPQLTEEATAEATLDAEATAEATMDAASTAEATAEATLDLLSDGAVMDALTLDRFMGARPILTGTQTILLITTDSLDPLLSLITVPPYAPTPLPTALPTFTPNPVSEVDQTATASSVFATQLAAITATAAAQITPEVTAEATAEATP